MKPSERFKDIEDNFDNMSFFDKDWLIARVKKLTEAIESAAFCLKKNSAHKYEIEEDLRKALEEE